MVLNRKPSQASRSGRASISHRIALYGLLCVFWYPYTPGFHVRQRAVSVRLQRFSGFVVRFRQSGGVKVLLPELFCGSPRGLLGGQDDFLLVTHTEEILCPENIRNLRDFALRDQFCVNSGQNFSVLCSLQVLVLLIADVTIILRQKRGSGVRAGVLFLYTLYFTLFLYHIFTIFALFL